MSKQPYILLFGGTTEGKACANWLNDMGFCYYYSSKTTTSFQVHKNCVKLEGNLSVEAMVQFCTDNHIQVIIDAAHPYARDLHWNINKACQQLAIHHIRVERAFGPRVDSKNVFYFTSLDEMMQHCQLASYQKIVSLMGVKSVGNLHKNLPEKQLWYRILDRPLSRDEALSSGVEESHILASNKFDKLNDVMTLIEVEKIDAILTKDSGYNGLFDQKLALAQRYQLPLLVLDKPALPEFAAVLKCRADLRRYLSEHFVLPVKELVHGYTSGTCATICAKAAASLLISGKCHSNVAIHLPDGELVKMPIHSKGRDNNSAFATVIKNSGDDPDLTDGQVIGCRIYKNNTGDICFVKGEGVGIVQLPGLGLPIGEPAINKVPRAMIEGELQGLLQDEEDSVGLDVEVFIPQGKRLAQKTFNPRLGVEGGLSIIGSTGRIKPFSSEAYVATIKRQLWVVEENEARHVVFNSGGRSEAYLKQYFNHLPGYCFVQYGNYIGEALKAASKIGIDKVSLGIMTGKAVKLAAGHLDTHSRKVVMDKDFITDLAQQANADLEQLKQIKKISMARELENIFPFNADEPFFQILKKKCEEVARSVVKDFKLEMLLINNKGEILQ
ncbi:cobalt-precorrin-5B (C(1))-methyltransferase CbiD [Carboxylicivirga marina]|uniref:Cobalt-precorrin-5B C(1)-methyltransferase n=1 Tax=Carboxylicivirga marina TaxID=2800988 RepID=A0ABS1HK65_9BACT|nr:cobalt-precorrin-5B (C(1))-methyltransferase CbiD [Carboxylicivirga marina]MBK3518073.1 cobalamin biosynthesis protein CbiD [Carboxylicivirga marina]